MGALLSCGSASPGKPGPDYCVTILPREETDGNSESLQWQVQPHLTLGLVPTGDSSWAAGGVQGVKGGGGGVNHKAKKQERRMLNKEDHKCGHSGSSFSSWKFWRRGFSSRGGQDHKLLTSSKEKSGIARLAKSESCTISDGVRTPASLMPLSAPLPDVVEKTPGVAKFSSSAVPPPKPPRLFLFRTPSSVSKLSTDAENETEPVYINSDRVLELKTRRNELSDSSKPENFTGLRDGRKDVASVDFGLNNNLVEQLSRNCILTDRRDEATSLTAQTHAGNSSPNISSEIQPVSQLNSLPKKPKIKTPDLSLRRGGRPRKYSHDKGQLTRQKQIMNSVHELLRQRLDPYPLLDQLKRLGVLNNVDVQSFLGYHDRKSICESIADLVANAAPDVLPKFCDVLSSSGNSREISEVIQVVRELDRIIHDVPSTPSSEVSILNDEQKVNYEVGYLAPDYSLKPLVELERVRTCGDKRLSKSSCRNSAYSLLEGGDSDHHRLISGALYPGLIMMSICVTGHSLMGQRARELASVIKNHNCICELRLGKTQLCGEDIGVIARALEYNRTIHSLDFRLNSIDSRGASAIVELLQKTKSLRLLNLSSTSLNQRSIKSIVAATATNRTVTDLDLSFLDISDESSECLRDLLRANINLQKLRLRCNSLSWVGCHTLAEGLVRNLGLNVLDLSRNNIGDAGVQALAKFLPDSSVTELCLENCGITEAGCDSLSELLTHCRKLTLLDVSTNVLLDVGVSQICTALERTSSLQNLSLNMCGITNDGFSKLLDVLEKNTSIVHMKLCYNRLGGEHSIPSATSDNLRYRLRIVTSSKPKLKILLWGNSFEES